MKMLLRSQWLGTGEATTRSLERAIMAPSLNTASSTIRMVGKYLRQTGSAQAPALLPCSAVYLCMVMQQEVELKWPSVPEPGACTAPGVYAKRGAPHPLRLLASNHIQSQRSFAHMGQRSRAAHCGRASPVVDDGE